jgi:hypothetical protein
MSVEGRLQKLFQDFWSWRLKRTPEFASLVGCKDYDDTLGPILRSSISAEKLFRQIFSLKFWTVLH